MSIDFGKIQRDLDSYLSGYPLVNDQGYEAWNASYEKRHYGRKFLEFYREFSVKPPLKSYLRWV